MRWDEIFAELEAEFSAAGVEGSESEIVDMVHAEAATISFASRIRHRSGRELSIRLRNGQLRRGIVHEANHVWLMLREGQHRYLIPHGAISYAWPLAAAAPEQQGISNRLTLGYVLRKLAGSGVSISLTTDGGDLQGKIMLVGADYFDLWSEQGTIAVPWQAVICIQG